MSDQWIHVVGWDRFQHPDATRSSRQPWIKNYTALMSKDEYLDLSFHLRGVLHSIWLAYATSGRQLRDNTSTLNRHLGQRVLRRDLERLNHAGLIYFSASKVASLEESREEKKDQEPASPLLPPVEKPVQAPPKPAVEKPKKPRVQDSVWDFVSELEGEPLPRYLRARGRMVADLKLLLKGVPEERWDSELRRRHGALAREWGDAKATVRALVQHWHRAGAIAAPGKNGHAAKGGFVQAKAWVATVGWQYPEADLVEDLAKKFVLRDEERIKLREIAFNLQKGAA